MKMYFSTSMWTLKKKITVFIEMPTLLQVLVQALTHFFLKTTAQLESFPHGKTEAQREMAAVAFMEEQLERVSPSNNAVTVEGEVTVPSKMMNVSPLPLNTEVQLFYL